MSLAASMWGDITTVQLLSIELELLQPLLTPAMPMGVISGLTEMRISSSNPRLAAIFAAAITDMIA